MENNKVKDKAPVIREIPPQPKTWELCPRCGLVCSRQATDYKNTRCWKITCSGCHYFAFATEEKK